MGFLLPTLWEGPAGDWQTIERGAGAAEAGPEGGPALLRPRGAHVSVGADAGAAALQGRPGAHRSGTGCASL